MSTPDERDDASEREVLRGLSAAGKTVICDRPRDDVAVVVELLRVELDESGVRRPP